MAFPPPETGPSRELLPISNLFNSLVESTSARSPTSNNPQIRTCLKLLPEEENKLEQLVKITNPPQLATAILQHPPQVNALIAKKLNREPKPTIIAPKIEIISPTPKELEWANKPITIPPETEEGQLLSGLVRSCQNFLGYPRIRDGLISHSLARRPWERSILRLLELMNEADPQERRWDDIFKREFWDKNKYSGAKKNAPLQWILVICEMAGQEQNNHPYQEMRQIAEKAIDENNRLIELQRSKQEDKSGDSYRQYIEEVDQAIDQLVEWTIEILQRIQSLNASHQPNSPS